MERFLGRWATREGRGLRAEGMGSGRMKMRGWRGWVVILAEGLAGGKFYVLKEME